MTRCLEILIVIRLNHPIKELALGAGFFLVGGFKKFVGGDDIDIPASWVKNAAELGVEGFGLFYLSEAFAVGWIDDGDASFGGENRLGNRAAFEVDAIVHACKFRIGTGKVYCVRVYVGGVNYRFNVRANGGICGFSGFFPVF